MRKGLFLALCALCVLAIAGQTSAKTYQGKKVLYIDSYHEGYNWSDGITKAIVSTLEDSGVELKIIRMDTKRNKSEEFKKEAALKAKTVIEEFQPDVVIASDDNASKYLIAQYYKNSDLPFVFCGVNWDASVYGFPTKNVTGMVEVAPVKELAEILRQFSRGDRVGFLGEDTLTDRKEAGFYKKILGLEIKDVYASTFAEWKKAFLELQDSVDILINYNYVSIEDWDHPAAAAFAQENARIPIGAVLERQLNHSLLGYVNMPEEQGYWAAKTALKILDGTLPSAIPVARNKEGKIMINMKIAEKLGVELPYEIIQSAAVVIE
jgi:ABC-type uncharacterized transport system substrate-binding protein